MVSSIAIPAATFDQLAAGLNDEDVARLRQVIDFVEPIYRGRKIITGQDPFEFSLGVANTLATLKTDVDTRIAFNSAKASARSRAPNPRARNDAFAAQQSA